MRLWHAVGLLVATMLSAAPKVPEGVELIRDLEYAQVKGISLKLDLYRPSAKPSAPMPLIIWVHGGPYYGHPKAFQPSNIMSPMRGAKHNRP